MECQHGLILVSCQHTAPFLLRLVSKPIPLGGPEYTRVARAKRVEIKERVDGIRSSLEIVPHLLRLFLTGKIDRKRKEFAAVRWTRTETEEARGHSCCCCCLARVVASQHRIRWILVGGRCRQAAISRKDGVEEKAMKDDARGIAVEFAG